MSNSCLFDPLKTTTKRRFCVTETNKFAKNPGNVPYKTEPLLEWDFLIFREKNVVRTDFYGKYHAFPLTEYVQTFVCVFCFDKWTAIFPSKKKKKARARLV